MKTLPIHIILTMGMIPFGCRKGSDAPPQPDSPKASPSGSPEPSPSGGDRDQKSGESGDGTLSFGVSAIAAQGAFLQDSAARNEGAGVPGSLAISLGLRTNSPVGRNGLGGNQGSFLSPPEDSRTPLLKSSSIGSGAPMEMEIKIKRIELLAGQPSERPENMGPIALTERVMDDRFGDLSPEKKGELKALVGQVFDTASELLTRVAEITGESPEVAGQQRLGPVVEDLIAAGRQARGLGPQSALVFRDDAGRPVLIANGTVDLSQLGNQPQSESESVDLKAATGVYNRVKVVYAARARIKGCVRMLYQCDVGTGQNCSGNHNDPVPGNADNGGPATRLIKYCTQAARSPYVANTQNADFIDKSPEMMEFPLTMPSSQWLTEEDVALEYPLELPIAIKPDAPARITLAVDLNRMLRYYNRGRQDKSVNPGAPLNKSFFFTTVFGQSTYVFVGEPGRIYGYEMIARVCQAPATYTNGSCSAGNLSEIPFWMTLITAPSGAPVKMILTPDDDNDLTITKGSDNDAVRCAFDATPQEPRKKWVRPNPGTSTAQIHFALCDNSSSSVPPPPGPYGRLEGFPVNLEDALIVPPSTPISLSPTPGNPQYVSGVTIESHARQNANATGQVYQGPVVIMRRL